MRFHPGWIMMIVGIPIVLLGIWAGIRQADSNNASTNIPGNTAPVWESPEGVKVYKFQTGSSIVFVAVNKEGRASITCR